MQTITLSLRKITLSRLLFVALAVVFIIILIATYYFGRQDDCSSKICFDKDRICHSPGCIKMAASMLEDMNTEVQPCNDFYEFVCGNTRLPSKISLMKSSFDQKLMELIDAISYESPSYQLKLKTLYDKCIYENLIDTMSIEELKYLLNGFGGWPVVKGSDWSESEFRWIDFIIKLKRMGYQSNYLIDFSVDTDPSNSSSKIIHLDQPEFGINMAYLTGSQDHWAVNNYKECMVGIATMLGANRSIAEKELQKSLDFEIELAKISIPPESDSSIISTFNLKSMSDIEENYGNELVYYLKEMILPLEQTLESIEKVNIGNVRYFEYFNLFISTRKLATRTLANYIFWRAILDSVIYMSRNFRLAEPKCQTVFPNEEYPERRKHECLADIKKRMPLATNALYAKNHLNNQSFDKILSMSKNIRKSFVKMIEQVDWMDDKTRIAAGDKLLNTNFSILHSPEILIDMYLDNYYRDLNFINDKYLTSSLDLNSFLFKKELEGLRNTVSWTSSYENAIKHLPFYTRKNNVFIPVESVDKYLFNSDTPYYAHYAMLGQTIGHAMAHAFDESHRIYDKNGNLAEWWTSKILKKYLRKLQCIEDRFSSYNIKNYFLHGEYTVNDNFADLVGLKAAYHAYIHKFKNFHKPEEPKLIGIKKFNSKQLFWISYASMWCEAKSDSDFDYELRLEMRTPNKFKVIGSVTNLDEFANDFHCKPGQPMNPSAKCLVF